MNLPALTNSLERFPSILRATCAGLDARASLARPDDHTWSILEIVAHLADEEELDFPERLRRTLDDPAQPWPSIDPEGWATERDYRARALDAELDRFERARDRQLAWLRTLASPDWNATHHHPDGWTISAGDLCVAWAAHDWLHLRQVAKRRFEAMNESGSPYRSKYAGEWGV